MSEQEPVIHTDPDLIKKQARAILLRHLTMLFGAIFATVSMTFLVLSAVVATQTRDALLDCVEPGGECAARSEERTSMVVQHLIDANSLDEIATRRIVILAAVCSEEPEIRFEPDLSRRITLMEACVNREAQQSDDEKEGGTP